ncbi:hypothetical protein APS56_08945 [Pseudalgibacter alginicilyticus]|uniref:Peptidase M14 domain-containing protein n=1 Tax=Pseudalgibacter alginicilyticus TaxID=1736674 RepID=A0A0P0CQZ2_9FLAO|nr:M14 family metallopeptidase [Pseudalgibacter alginicilyticus]ALJ05243.1 hypothetical protein APS56_08945 [Pseudalgibacter alginicilyticus]
MVKKALYFVLFFTVVSCSGVKTVEFITPVDTSSKPITYQLKKTYELSDLGVFVTNEFDGARLNGLKKINDSTAQVIINPENTPINNSAYYAFKTWAKTSKPFYFTFKYPENYKHRYVAKLKKGNTWRIIDSSQVFKNNRDVTIKVNLTTEPMLIAAQEIQSSTDVKNWYTELINGKEAFVNPLVYGKTPLGKDLTVLNISKGNPKGKNVIVLLTRQHPPEVTGYYAFQSFLETILNDSELSNKFLSKYHVLVFPLMNPDGVDLGHWRHNSGGIDTNRDWSVYNQPEIKQTVKYITKTLNKNKAKLILGLDFHSTYHDVFYTNETRESTALPNFIDDWFAGLENNIPNYKVNEDSGNSTKPVSKGWFLNGHDAVGITYEIGDATPKERIKVVGEVSAKEMMKILTQ